jgi:glycosyltransferase involved in cell wall biosynthesis
MTSIHQVLATFARRDAIGNHAVAIRDVLHGMGIGSEIFAAELSPGAGSGARPIRELGTRLPGEGEAWLLYHASIGSTAADWVLQRPERKLVDYHNITPASLTAPWEPAVGVELEHGRRQLAALAAATEWGLADSSYNERELIDLGYRRTAVLPILFSPVATHVDTAVADRLQQRQQREGGADWLFVSRIMPHKAQHDVIKAFAVYRRVYDPSARLTIIGGVGSARYADALAQFVDDLGLNDVIDLAGSVSGGALAAHYRTASVYVALSDHEGFGVPLLEAMAHDLPVVTYGGTAVPETVDGAALLLENKRPTTVAAAVHRLLADAALRDELVRCGRERLVYFAPEAGAARLRELVNEIVAA